VVIAIIAILMALLVPAVQKVREAAARTQCANNLKQLGTAIHAYHTEKKAFPPARVMGGGAPWTVFILPYIEQKSLFELWDFKKAFSAQTATFTTPVPTYLCPARRGPTISQSTGGATAYNSVDKIGALSDYATTSGIDDYWVDPSLTDAPGAMISASGTIASWRSQTKLKSIQDGTSNTLLAGEKHIPLTLLAVRPKDLMINIPNPETDATCDETFWNSTPGCVNLRALGEGGYEIVPDPRIIKGSAQGGYQWANRFGSVHPGVCQFVFCDGTVRALSIDTSGTTLKLLVHRADGLPPPTLP
jgi:type II secretory pathway pseudopilin PulG